MKLNKIVLTDFNVVAKEDFAMAISMEDNYPYVDGVRSEKPHGFKFQVVLEKNDYEKIVLKAEESNMTVEDFKRLSQNTKLYVKPVDFTGKFYMSKTSNLEISASCSKCIIVDEKGDELF